jgi:hypothetical protein
MSAATYSVGELASSIGYRSVRDCARNMGRVANYARDKYPFLAFNTRYYYVTHNYMEEWVCVDGMMCQKSLWLTAIFCANNSSKLTSVHKFLTQEFMNVPIVVRRRASFEDLVRFFIVQEYCDAQILQVLLGLPARSEFINLVEGMMCQKSLWLTAIFCANNSSKLASVHKFLTQEFMNVPIEDLVRFFIVQEYCDAQILQVLLGLPARSEFINLVEAMLSVHQIEPQAIWWEYYRQPKSYNYNLPLPVVKSIVRHVKASEDFANNPMREFVTRLDNYFTTLNARSQRLYQRVEDDAAIALESVPDSMTIDIESEAKQSLDLTIPLLLFVGLLAWLGWIHPNGCW